MPLSLLYAVKHKVQRYQIEAGEDEVSKIKDCYQHYKYCAREMGLGHQQFLAKKGHGIYRRVFHWVPLSGPDSIDRRIQQCNALKSEDLGGIKSLHQLMDIGKPGACPSP